MLAVPTQYEVLEFKVRYVKHNGFTHIQLMAKPDMLPKHRQFAEWFWLHSNHNTRYDKPHWYKPIRLGRKKKIVIWALESIDLAYSAFYTEYPHLMASELQKAA